MEFIRKVWEFLNGKKAAIAAALYFIGMALVPFLINDMGIVAPWLAKLADICVQIANWLAPLGVGHKLVKNAEGTEG